MKNIGNHRQNRRIVAVGLSQAGKRLGTIEMSYPDWDAMSRAQRLAYLSSEFGKSVINYQWNFQSIT
jgi:hypothetical protein